MSLDKAASPINYTQYFMRRLFRIIPMYYLVTIFAFMAGGIPDYLKLFNTTNSSKNLVAHLTFTNLFQMEYRNSLIGVEWSVPIELFYYLILPLFYIFFKKIKFFGLHLFFVSFSLALLGSEYLNFDHSSNREIVYHWSVVKYVFCFSFGYILYEFQKKYKSHLAKFNDVFLIELFILLICYICSRLPRHEEFIAVWTGALILFLQGRTQLGKLLFENKFMLFVGTISYSFYLIHYLILTILTQLNLNSFEIFFAGLILTLFLSNFCYKYIEKPCIDFGKKLIK